MAFQRPTLSEIIERIKNDLISRLNSGSAVLRRSVIYIISITIGGAIHMIYGYLDFISKQLFPSTATGEFLDRWASIWGVIRKPADFARGQVIFTGVDGTLIPMNREMQRPDGVKYTVWQDAYITGGTATVRVTANEAGEDGNVNPGVKLSLITPIAGVQSEGEVDTSGLFGGINVEQDEPLRSRLLQRIQNPPAGGSRADFERWALEISGVTRAWIYPNGQGAGTVGISFVLDGQPDIFPDSIKVDEVQAYIDERRPITMTPYVFSPIENPILFDIRVTPNTSEVRSAVEQELKDLFLREGEPGGTILISHIREAISISTGEHDHILLEPNANVVSPAGELPTVGTITWS